MQTKDRDSSRVGRTTLSNSVIEHVLTTSHGYINKMAPNSLEFELSQMPCTANCTWDISVWTA